MTQLKDALVSLRKEKNSLESQLARVNAALDALTGSSETEKPPARSRRKRRGMTAEGKRAVSERMKKYWADRRAGRKK